jgi:hypothetical protein
MIFALPIMNPITSFLISSILPTSYPSISIPTSSFPIVYNLTISSPATSIHSSFTLVVIDLTSSITNPISSFVLHFMLFIIII